MAQTRRTFIRTAAAGMGAALPLSAAELESKVLGEFVHGTFFYDKSRRYVLVQILNAIELATQAQYVTVPEVEIRVNSERLKVTAARVVWPEERGLAVESRDGKLHVTLPRPERYTALYLKLA